MVQYTSCSDVLVSPVALCALGALMTCIHAPPHERRPPLECLLVGVSDCTFNLAYWRTFIVIYDSCFTIVCVYVCVCARAFVHVYGAEYVISLYEEFSHSRMRNKKYNSMAK